MKTALVCGGGGFIGGHLINRLKKEGYFVRGVDLKGNEYGNDKADEFVIGDLRDPHVAEKVVKGMNEVYKGRFGQNPPVRTTVAVAKGGVPGDSLVEIDCIAYK